MSAGVTSALSRQGIHASSEWIEACVNWCQQTDPCPQGQPLLTAVKEQWLITDIQDEGIQSKPQLKPQWTSEKLAKCNIPCSLTLQVLYAVDISQSSYSQLQTLLKVDTENARVSADNNEAPSQVPTQYKPAGWEPKASRMLKLILTDGFSTIKAVEHEPINDLDNHVPPGQKIQLFGPMVCRRGVILLTRKNVRVMGGSVDDMAVKFDRRKILSDIIGTENVGQSTGPTVTIGGNAIEEADDDIFSQIEMPATVDREERVAPAVRVEAEPTTFLSPKPFVYLSTCSKRPHGEAMVKACVVTLASRLAMKNSAGDKRNFFWHVSVVITDGTESSVCTISPSMLTEWIGVSPREYGRLDGERKSEVKQSIQAASDKLMHFNGAMRLKFLPAETVILAMTELNRGHVQQLKVRLSKTDDA